MVKPGLMGERAGRWGTVVEVEQSDGVRAVRAARSRMGERVGIVH